MWRTAIKRLAAGAAVLVTISATAASAAIPSGNLLQNPGAEDAQGALPGWTVAGSLTSAAYGTAGTLGFDQRPSDGGANFFAGGEGTELETGYQLIDVSQAADEIDSCSVNATAAGLFGGFESQGDQAGANVSFLDASGAAIDALQVGFPTAADRGGVSGLLAYSRTKVVPAGTRAIRYTVAAQRTDGTYNDGYADNLALTLAHRDPPPPADPVAGQSVVLAVVRGNVKLSYHITIHVPAGRCALSPADIQRIIDQIGVFLQFNPVIDARKGEVKLTAAKDASGATQSGRFSGGVFGIEQKPGPTPITELVMKGGSFAACRRGNGRAMARRVVRQLFGTAKGHFRTRGRNSSATIRGTSWLVKETCAGTLTISQHGTVVVRDLVKQRTITLHSGERYLARPR
jgi:hypothetical protein